MKTAMLRSGLQGEEDSWCEFSVLYNHPEEATQSNGSVFLTATNWVGGRVTRHKVTGLFTPKYWRIRGQSFSTFRMVP